MGWWDGLLKRIGWRKAKKEEAREESIPAYFYPSSLQAMQIYRRLLVAFPSLRQRHRGQGPAEPFTRERTLALARDLESFNPYAGGLLSTLEMLVIGKGIKYAIEGDDAAVREQAQEWLDAWLDKEDWPQREAEGYRRSKRDGEAFFRLKGTAYRFIDPEHIKARNASIEWADGILTEEGDTETAVSYAYDDGEHQEEIPAAEVYHIKANVDRCVKRGVSDFLSTSEAIEDAWTTARNQVKRAARLAGILFITQHEQAEKADVDDLILNQQTDYTRPAPAVRGGTESVSIKQGVGIEHIDKGQTLASPPNPEAAEAENAAINTALLGVGRKYSLPLWMVSGDASNSGFASALVAESPLARKTDMEQVAYCRHMRNVVWKAIEAAVEANELPSAALGLDLVVTAHSAVPRDKKGETERLSKLEAEKVISKRKRTAEEGYDYEEQQAQIRQEKAEQARLAPPAPPPAPPPEGGGGRPPGSPPAAPPQRLHQVNGATGGRYPAS